MSQSMKRKRPESKPASGLTEPDQVVINFIKSKGENGIAKRNIHQETKLPSNIVNKCIKNLIALSLITESPHAQSKAKHYIATEFIDEFKDSVFIGELRDICLHIVKKRLKVATPEGVNEFIKKNRMITIECTSQQISEILGSMVLDNLIIEVKSSGIGEYHSIPVGNVCYRCAEGNLNQGPNRGAMASVPCGVCPMIRECTPDGPISPSTCVYYTKWLDF